MNLTINKFRENVDIWIISSEYEQKRHDAALNRCTALQMHLGEKAHIYVEKGHFY